MDNLAKLKAEVFAKRKVLAKIYEQSAQKSLFDYARGWPVSLPTQNTNAFFAQAQKVLLKIYTPELVNKILPRAGRSPLVSTIDHHGILNHPFFVNSNLIFSLGKNIKYLLCLSTSGVSLNNSSWPGCLLVTGADAQQKRFSFFPDKIKNMAVLGTRAFSRLDVKRISSRIQTANFLPGPKQQRLVGLVEEIFNRPEIFEFSSFSAQAAFVSHLLWAKVFPGAPQLVYLPLEELISGLIVNEIAKDKNSILHKLLFTQAGWHSAEQYFSGSHKGSFLFWGLENGRRSRLARQGRQLLGPNFSVPPDVETIAGMLLAKQLYPTSLVSFLVLLYYGLTCLGGFNQVDWLTAIKEKFTELLKASGEQSLAGVHTENFAEGSLAFGVNGRGQIYKPTGLDLFLENDSRLYEKYKQLALQITLGESVVSQLPEMYKVISPGPKRNASLSKITEADIISQTGLAGKIKLALMP